MQQNKKVCNKELKHELLPWSNKTISSEKKRKSLKVQAAGIRDGKQ